MQGCRGARLSTGGRHDDDEEEEDNDNDADEQVEEEQCSTTYEDSCNTVEEQVMISWCRGPNGYLDTR